MPDKSEAEKFEVKSIKIIWKVIKTKTAINGEICPN